MAVSVPGQDPWIVAGWAFRQLLDRARESLADPDDLEELDDAKLYKHLGLARLPESQARRIRTALDDAARALENELRNGDEVDREFAERLSVLRVKLNSV